MPSLNTPVQRLKVTILPLDVPCSGPVTHSGEILTTGKSHGKRPDRETSGCVRPERVKKWFISMTDNKMTTTKVTIVIKKRTEWKASQVATDSVEQKPVKKFPLFYGNGTSTVNLSFPRCATAHT
jgi:hypothetical protein